MPPSPPTPPDEIRRALGQVLHDARFQTALPEADKPWIDPETLRLFAPFVRFLLWVGLAVVVGLVLRWVYLEVSQLGRDATLETSDAARDPLLASTAYLTQADRFAAQGRFADAIRAVLLAGFAELQQRTGTTLSAALTSREVLRATTLTEAPRTALAGLVASVELACFGGAAVQDGDYRAARENYAHFSAKLPR